MTKMVVVAPSSAVATVRMLLLVTTTVENDVLAVEAVIIVHELKPKGAAIGREEVPTRLVHPTNPLGSSRLPLAVSAHL